MRYELFLSSYLELQPEKEFLEILVGLSGQEITRRLAADASPEARSELFGKFNSWAKSALKRAEDITVRLPRKELASVLVAGPKAAVLKATNIVEEAARRQKTELDYCPANATLRVGQDMMMLEY